jgi:gamma-glutamyltranspeptidase / glutathione hydrolase
MVAIGWDLPYRSRRMPVLGSDVVATSQPLAVAAGMAMFERGGNAIDAALAAAMALTVVEPTGNGLGSDAFAIVHDGERLHGLNASGRSPAGLDVDRLREREAMPVSGWDAVTVPGAVSGWVELNDRFGDLDLPEVAAPAVRLAREGFPVSPLVAAGWSNAQRAFAHREDFAATFLPSGRAPTAGEWFANPPQGDAIAEIADTRGRSFYEGLLAERIVAHAEVEGGPIRGEDLERHTCDWVDPLSLRVGEATVHELPPSGQGIATLIALGVAERAGGAGAAPDDPEGVHRQVEAMKLAFDEVHTQVADVDAMTIAPDDMLAPARLERLAEMIDPERSRPHGRVPVHNGTVYLTTADAGGRMVSLIQSNYMGFGSGVVVPGTGISLQNRGAGFVTADGHPNVVAPRKRPFHTIIPGFATWEDGTRLAFGVMGGPMQPQGHLQVATRIAGFGENPQAAIDAPRWRLDRGAIGALGPGGRDHDQPWELAVEDGTDLALLDALRRRGHVIRCEERWNGAFGGAQAVLSSRHGGYVAGSDPRKDGHAAAR